MATSDKVIDVAEKDFRAAQARAEASRNATRAVAAAYEGRRRRLVLTLANGVIVMTPVRLLEGLADAAAADLNDVEISPTGLGLHWPRLDADLHVPALLQGIFGSKRWIAAQLGASGGKVSSPAKRNAARENGRKGGRPRKQA